MTINNNSFLDDVLAKKQEIAFWAMEFQFLEQSELKEAYSKRVYEICLRDIGYTIEFLVAAYRMSSTSLFADYCLWLKGLLGAYNVSKADLEVNLKKIKQALYKIFDQKAVIFEPFFADGIAALAQEFDNDSFLKGSEKIDVLATNYFNTLLRGDRKTANNLIQKAVLEDGVSIQDIYLLVFQRSQYEVGRLWQINKISVAQEHFFSAATQMIMSNLYTHIISDHRNGYTFVGASVGKELHEIGLRMVADFLEMDGWDTYYLGSNTPLKSIEQALDNWKADLLGLSATMTFHSNLVAEAITYFKSMPRFQHLKIIVGGYPFIADENLWRKVGADAVAVNAKEALYIANQLVKGAIYC